MTPSTTQRLAVSALAPCPVCNGTGEMPVIAHNGLHERDVECRECGGFGTTEQPLTATREQMEEKRG